MTESSSDRCPACNTRLVSVDRVVRCSECGAVQHETCWQRLGHCATEGCAGGPVAVASDMPPSPQPAEAGASAPAYTAPPAEFEMPPVAPPAPRAAPPTAVPLGSGPAMPCPACGYVMGQYDIECPRCRRQRQDVAHAAVPPPSLGSAPAPPQSPWTPPVPLGITPPTLDAAQLPPPTPPGAPPPPPGLTTGQPPPAPPPVSLPRGVAVDAQGIPQEIKGWNWAAFALTPVWCGAMQMWSWLGVWVVLVLLSCGCDIFRVGLLALPIYLGIDGNKWAWQARRFASIREFTDVQAAWRPWGIGFFIFWCLLAVAGVAALVYYVLSDMP